ncbi:MAG: hypothetical protein EBZ67_16825 [Chitinophagia bacterium]|nr:hypothetical protein [Chitinophagia bacterium]
MRPQKTELATSFLRLNDLPPGGRATMVPDAQRLSEYDQRALTEMREAGTFFMDAANAVRLQDHASSAAEIHS